ncbi:hypothetical protein WJX72_008898 [[Myrmecia] bisecta]|uniref:Thiamine phosphate synthase/TenI domain-containing protein n=1 Tax=[Myrmecia] bisecta TaxID=41462 RepID=A0AAW1QRN3_9CHLO
MCDLGLQTLHLRKPGWSRDKYAAYIEQIQPNNRRRVVLHDWHELASTLHLKGIHYTERNRPAAPIQHHPPLTISTACHSLQQLAAGFGAVDYVLLSPIFDSISKEGYKAAYPEPDALKQAVRSAGVPVIALGGVGPSNLQFACDLGFAGVAVLGAVWQAVDPVQAFVAIARACQEPD